jgi:nucleoside-diphosphate-sugar epimerase
MKLNNLPQKYPNKKFVTGATGFVGQNLVNSLTQKGYAVYILTRKESPIFLNNKNVKVIIGDITDPINLPKDVDAIYHCAGVIDGSKEMEKVNVLGTQNIVNIAIKNNCELIYLSSAGITGKTKEIIINENTICNPQNDYEISKYRAEQIVKDAIKNGLRAQILRPSTILGNKNNIENDSFFQLIKSMRTCYYKKIGQGVCNIVHIDEVVKAMEMLNQENIPNGEVYLINNSITYKDMDILVKNLPPIITKKTNNIPYVIAYIITIILTIIYFIINKKNPLTFSRLKALTNKKKYSQNKIEKDLLFQNTYKIEEYIKKVYEECIALGLIH